MGDRRQDPEPAADHAEDAEQQPEVPHAKVAEEQIGEVLDHSDVRHGDQQADAEHSGDHGERPGAARATHRQGEEDADHADSDGRESHRSRVGGLEQ
jgi:hypothetical protein